MMSSRAYLLLKTPEFADWFEDQSARSMVQIDSRLRNIELYGHFGDHKNLCDDLWELKWKNGRRLYYTHIFHKGRAVLLILGGNKNGQSKDIAKAKKILRRETEVKAKKRD